MRTFATVDELVEALREFKRRHNERWYQSPLTAGPSAGRLEVPGWP